MKANDNFALKKAQAAPKMTALFPPRDRGLFSKRPRSFGQETAVFFRPFRSAFRMQSNSHFGLQFGNKLTGSLTI